MTTYVTRLECVFCGEEYEDQPMFEGCPSCKTKKFVSNVAPIYDYDVLAKKISRKTFENFNDMWAYADLLPVDIKYAITLGEGGTPLIECPTFGSEESIKLYIKDESQNPTWSFKDRLCSVAVSKAVEIGAKKITIASTGNHGASTAAYAGRAGLESVVFTLESVPETMKIQIGAYGAKILATKEPKDRWILMKECIDKFQWYPTGNYMDPPVGSNFYGIEGYKTIAYEICAQLGWNVPEWVVQPTAYGDGLSGIWRGFKDLYELELIDKLPRMVAVEPFGSLKKTLDTEDHIIKSVEMEPTIAFSIGTSISTYQGLATLRESNGLAVLSEDEEIRKLQHTVGEKVGIYAEAAAIASVLGVERLKEEGEIKEGETVVSISTSSGLKDAKMTGERMGDVPVVDSKIESILKYI